MKNIFFFLLAVVLVVFTSIYLHTSEPKFKKHLEKNIPMVAKILTGGEKKLENYRVDVRLLFPLILLFFLVIEFFPSQNYKKSPGMPKYLAAVFILGVGFTIALVAFIYSLPQDKMILGKMVIDRGPKETFLSTVIHYTILIGNAHLLSLLVVTLWMQALKKKKGGEEE